MKFFDQDKWNEIFVSIQKHKLRTTLTALGVFWGIFLLVILLGSGQGMQNGIEKQFRGDALNSIWMYGGSTSKTFNGLPKGRRIQFNNDDFENLQEQFPEIEYLAGRVFLSGTQILKYKKKNLSFSVFGVSPDMIHVENAQITSGRFLNKTDEQKRRKVAVIGSQIKDEVFGNEDPIGKDILLGDGMYRVVGISHDPESNQAQREIYIPMSVAQVVFHGNENISNLSLIGGDLSEEQVNQLQQGITETLAANHQFDPTDNRALYINNRYEDYKRFQNLFLGIKSFLWFVGLGTVLAGIVGVSNIMLIIVKDRTKEIGIRKALGATPRSIVSMILTEAIFITSMAGYFGLAAGIVVLSLLDNLDSDFFSSPEINLGVGLAAIIILVIAGALAGLIPSMQAAKINPIVAMRTD
ncbi:ABC transporter permease [Membranihabitans maritimus]|uniref:ABC transporter permease n=1 Tax=Membranihabitans maritimus TaxID=2904244 RepID=UPI001F2128A7|nr:ABC transporter permease [Membranihabitans maritimus]